MENREIQGWLVGYKEYGAWRSINLPGEKYISEKLIERILFSINQESDIVYQRLREGTHEKDNHHTKKGMFIGL